MLRKFLLLLLLTACARKIPDEVSLINGKDFIPKIPQRDELIVVDAGHGGHDTGSMSKAHDYMEKHLALDTAILVRQYLQEMGYKTQMTRSNDSYVTLSDRAKLANELEADLFVSVHYNHCPSHEPHGIEVFTYKEHSPRTLESRRVAEQVSSHVVKYTGMHSRGVKQGNLAVVRETRRSEEHT